MIYFAIYIVGVLVGLGVMRDRWPVRIGTALVWPLGPAAFLVVVSILVAAAVVLWPLRMILGIGGIGLLLLLLGTAF